MKQYRKVLSILALAFFGIAPNLKAAPNISPNAVWMASFTITGTGNDTHYIQNDRGEFTNLQITQGTRETVANPVLNVVGAKSYSDLTPNRLYKLFIGGGCNGGTCSGGNEVNGSPLFTRPAYAGNFQTAMTCNTLDISFDNSSLTGIGNPATTPYDVFFLDSPVANPNFQRKTSVTGQWNERFTFNFTGMQQGSRYTPQIVARNLAPQTGSFNKTDSGTTLPTIEIPLCNPNDTGVRMSQLVYRVDENDPSGKVTVTLERVGQARNFKISYKTIDGSAKKGIHYTEKFGEVTFTTSDASKTVDIPIIDNGTADNNVSFAFQIFNPVNLGGSGNVILVEPSISTIIIRDDENPNPSSSYDITSLSPSFTRAGVRLPNDNMVVFGFGLPSASVIYWNDAPLTTTYGTQNYVTAQVPSSLIAQTGTAKVDLRVSGIKAPTTLIFTIIDPNACIDGNLVPTLTSMTPTFATENTPVTLTVTGTNFMNGLSKIHWNGVEQPTTFLSSTQLRATIPANLVTGTSASVTVVTPAGGADNCGGGTTAALTFNINRAGACPVGTTVDVSGVNPTSVTGTCSDTGPDTDLDVNGCGFTANTRVLWSKVGANPPVNGEFTNKTLQTGNTQIKVKVPASVLHTVGQLSITVVEGGSTGPSAATLNINPNDLCRPAPEMISINPDKKYVGDAAFPMTVTGRYFYSDSTVLFAGSPRPTTFTNSTTLVAQIPASDMLVAANHAITVNTPNGGTSGSAVFQVVNPLPVLASIQPSNAIAGSPAFTLTANGSKFIGSSVLRWNGANQPTTFVNGSQLTAQIPANLIASPGSASITVFNPTPEGGLSNALSFTITDLFQGNDCTDARTLGRPCPSSINPTFKRAGSGQFTLTVSGMRFDSGATVLWNNSTRTTFFGSSSQLTATIDAADVASIGTAQIRVRNSNGLESTNYLVFTITPALTLTGLNPSSTLAGGSSFLLTLTGTGFISGQAATVHFGASNYPVTMNSATQIQVSINASDIAQAGPRNVFVELPGEQTNSMNFDVLNPAPSNISLNPDKGIVGTPGMTITINGTGIVSGSQATWNGSPRTVTFLTSPARLSMQITAADLANTGTANVQVVNPTPGGGTSNTAVFRIENPLPQLTSLSPSGTTPGNPATGSLPVTINGSGFISTSQAMWNGSARTTTFVSATQLTMTVLAADVATIGNYPVTVVNAAPGGGTSNAIDFSVQPTPNPVPQISGLLPSSTNNGGPEFTLTVNGSNFVGTSIVRWNGSPRETTYIGATELRAKITAADIQDVGTAAVSVFSPNPGGGTSGSLTFTITQAPNPIPTIVSFNPPSATAGGATFTLTITGTGFVGSPTNKSEVRWNGSPRTTVFVDANTLRIQVPAADIVDSGNAAITVFNPAPAGGESVPKDFPINPSSGNSGYRLISIDPAAVPVGYPGFDMKLIGEGFSGRSIVLWNGTTHSGDVVTTVISSTELRARIPSSMLLASGVFRISVDTPEQTPNRSNELNFTIHNGPLLSLLDPAAARVGAAGFNLKATGQRFDDPGAVLLWDGAVRPTMVAGRGELTAQISAADIASAKTVKIKIRNLNGLESNEIDFPITEGMSITSLTPNKVPQSTAQTLTIQGANFGASATVSARRRDTGAAAWSKTASGIVGNSFTVSLAATDIPDIGLFWVRVVSNGDTIDNLPFEVTEAPRVDRVQIVQRNVRIRVDERVTFTANVYDQFGNLLDSNTTPAKPNVDFKMGYGAQAGRWENAQAAASTLVAVEPAEHVDIIATVMIAGVPAIRPDGSAILDQTIAVMLDPNASTDVSNAYAYPVPWKKGISKDCITFKKLAPNAKIQIFTSYGQMVKEIDVNAIGSNKDWCVDNESGEKVASGVYFYHIKHETGAKDGKLMIIK